MLICAGVEQERLICQRVRWAARRRRREGHSRVVLYGIGGRRDVVAGVAQVVAAEQRHGNADRLVGGRLGHQSGPRRHESNVGKVVGNARKRRIQKAQVERVADLVHHGGQSAWVGCRGHVDRRSDYGRKIRRTLGGSHHGLDAAYRNGVRKIVVEGKRVEVDVERTCARGEDFARNGHLALERAADRIGRGHRPRDSGNLRLSLEIEKEPLIERGKAYHRSARVVDSGCDASLARSVLVSLHDFKLIAVQVELREQRHLQRLRNRRLRQQRPAGDRHQGERRKANEHAKNGHVHSHLSHEMNCPEQPDRFPAHARMRARRENEGNGRDREAAIFRNGGGVRDVLAIH